MSRELLSQLSESKAHSLEYQNVIENSIIILAENYDSLKTHIDLINDENDRKFGDIEKELLKIENNLDTKVVGKINEMKIQFSSSHSSPRKYINNNSEIAVTSQYNDLSNQLISFQRKYNELSLKYDNLSDIISNNDSTKGSNLDIICDRIQLLQTQLNTIDNKVQENSNKIHQLNNPIPVINIPTILNDKEDDIEVSKKDNIGVLDDFIMVTTDLLSVPTDELEKSFLSNILQLKTKVVKLKTMLSDHNSDELTILLFDIYALLNSSLLYIHKNRVIYKNINNIYKDFRHFVIDLYRTDGNVLYPVQKQQSLIDNLSIINDNISAINTTVTSFIVDAQSKQLSVDSSLVQINRQLKSLQLIVKELEQKPYEKEIDELKNRCFKLDNMIDKITLEYKSLKEETDSFTKVDQVLPLIDNLQQDVDDLKTLSEKTSLILTKLSTLSNQVEKKADDKDLKLLQDTINKFNLLEESPSQTEEISTKRCISCNREISDRTQSAGQYGYDLHLSKSINTTGGDANIQGNTNLISPENNITNRIQNLFRKSKESLRPTPLIVPRTLNQSKSSSNLENRVFTHYPRLLPSVSSNIALVKLRK